jgi:hypothetical protein
MKTRSWMLVAWIGGLALAATPAAANTIWVHQTDPTCGGRGTSGVTCFMTIQDGVNHANAPAQVFVFPGTYQESVDISTMATPGDLTLTTVNASGTPAAGTVSVTPMAGRAFHNSVSPFPGNLSVNGFTVLSTDSDGLSILKVNGTATLSHLTANGNKTDGLVIAATGDLTIDSCTANSNGVDGFSFGGAAVTLRNNTANLNPNDGFDGGANLDLTFDSCTASSNGHDGFDFGAKGDVTIDSCTASSNGHDGFDFGGTAVTLRNSTANLNSGDGFDFGAKGDVTIDSCTANSNGSDGFGFGATAVTLRNSTANLNSGDGFDFGARPGDVTIDSCTANSNGHDGFDFGGAAVTLRNNTANLNVHDGFDFGGATVTMQGSQADGNKTNGIEFDASAADLTCNDFAGNTLAGLVLNSSITAMAQHNWWGAASGPTVAGNPGGTGDKIISESGTVNFTPFLTESLQFSPFCSHTHGTAPAMSEVGLAVAGVLLLGAGAWLARRRVMH